MSSGDARAQAPTQELKRGLNAAAASLEGTGVVLAVVIAGGSGCAYVTHTVSHSTEKLRLEVKEDLKPLTALNTSVTVMQETLKAVQETLKAVQETLKAQQETLKAVQETLKGQQETLKGQQETLKAQQTKLDAVLLGVGFLGLGMAFLHNKK